MKGWTGLPKYKREESEGTVENLNIFISVLTAEPVDLYTWSFYWSHWFPIKRLGLFLTWAVSALHGEASLCKFGGSLLCGMGGWEHCCCSAWGLVRRWGITRTVWLCSLCWDLGEDVVLLPTDLFNILRFSGTGGFVALPELFCAAMGRGKSKSWACLIQSFATCADSAVVVRPMPAKGLIWLTTTCASENGRNLCQLFLQKKGKVMSFAELFWERPITPSTRTPWCACQASAVYFCLTGRNASKPFCSTKGSASTSEQRGVARTTINVSFAARSIHLARNTVYLYRKAGGQDRGAVP